MTPELIMKLAQAVSDNYDKYDGFVITHGTDTMAYSAAALSYMLQNLGKPVVFTGSQLPIEAEGTDAITIFLTQYILHVKISAEFMLYLMGLR